MNYRLKKNMMVMRANMWFMNLQGSESAPFICAANDCSEDRPKASRPLSPGGAEPPCAPRDLGELFHPMTGGTRISWLVYRNRCLLQSANVGALCVDRLSAPDVVDIS